MKLLVVDDSSTMRKIILRNLRHAGIATSEVVEASDGVEAFELLEGGGFDLVFTDVNMPNMNGVELLEKIRAADGLKNLPVVMITTESTQEADRDHSRRRARPDAWRKPFTADQLEAVVSSLL